MSFRKIVTPDQNLQKVQDAIEGAIKDLNSGTFSGGRVLKVAMNGGVDNLISHGLSRVPQYWLLLGKDAATDIWETPSSSLQGKSATDKLINLTSNVNCNIILWVN